MNKKIYLSRSLKQAILALTLALTPLLPAQEAPKKELSEATITELPKLKELADAKKYKEGIDIIDQLLAKAAPESFDVALLSQIKAQLLLSTNNYIETIPLLEKAYSLGSKYAFFENKMLVDQLYLLTQLNYQLASESKVTAQQSKYFDAAYNNITLWLQKTPAPTADGFIFASSILFSQATINPSKIDTEKLKLAREQASNGLYLQLAPKEQLYQLILSATQQLEDLPTAVDLLELLVTKQPTSLSYWQQLLSTYLALGAEAKNDKDIFKYNLRAALTLERAQKNGLMASTKDNINLVGIYYNLQQFGRVGELLEQGLKSGGIENTRRNWEMLANAYQQIGADDTAINALTRGAKLFPDEGQLDATLGTLHYNAGRVKEANQHLVQAVQKGKLDKTGATYIFLAYTSYELQEYNEASRWAAEAGKQTDTRKEDLERLTKAINNAIKTRENMQNAKI